MKKLRIYLDTSIISFIFADDSPDYKKATIDFFENYSGNFEVWISPFVLFELNNTKDEELKSEFINSIQKYNIQEIIIDDDKKSEIENLKNEYIKRNIVPEKKVEDAYHIAISTVYEFDVLLSWNFKHLANVRKNILLNNVNKEFDFLKELKIITPLEVMYNEED